jgi:preprotein translocase SecE subunit
MAEDTKPSDRPSDSGPETRLSVPETKPQAPAAPQSIHEKKIFNFYRPEEGHRSRAIGGLSLAALMVYGAFSFFEWLPADWKAPLPKIGDLLSEDFRLSVGSIMSVLLGVGFLIGIYKLINFPRFVDFLVETEAELKKVSWASRRQVITESIVVVATVLILGVYIFLIDTVIYHWQHDIPWDSFWDKIRG